MSRDRTGVEFEQQVAGLFRALGAWKVEHNVPMAGHQIDVYVEKGWTGGFLHRVAVEAKDWQSPVGIDVVSKWALVVDDLRRAGLVDEGVIVSPVGFTKPAREAVAGHVRRGLPMRLLELVDLQAPAGVDLDRLREEYLAFLVNSYRRLDFRGIVQTKTPVELPLAKVYVSLNVAPSGGGRVEPREVVDEAGLRERAERLESEQRLRVQQAQEAERRRIAREMHDVLAHRLSLLSVHAGALEFRPDAPPDEVAEAAGVIRKTAQRALQELRDVIGVLRDETEERIRAGLERIYDEYQAEEQDGEG